MENSILHTTISKFFDRIAILNGTLYHLERSIINYSKEYAESWQNQSDEKPKYALYSRLVISDITGSTDNGWPYNYPTLSDYNVGLNDYEKKTNDLITQFSHFVIAQSYEAFETYIKDIIAVYFSINTEAGMDYLFRYSKKEKLFTRLLKFIRIIKRTEPDPNQINWKTEVRKFPPSKNNKLYFIILRKLLKENSNFETDNNYNLNLKEWYHQFSLVRHAITHSNSNIEKSKIRVLKNQAMFRKYFPVIDADQFIEFNIDRAHAREICKLIAEYAFQFFKFLSIKQGLNWMILVNMNDNYEA